MLWGATCGADDQLLNIFAQSTVRRNCRLFSKALGEDMDASRPSFCTFSATTTMRVVPANKGHGFHLCIEFRCFVTTDRLMSATERPYSSKSCLLLRHPRNHVLRSLHNFLLVPDVIDTVLLHDLLRPCIEIRRLLGNSWQQLRAHQTVLRLP
jgi:hypothetical protein